MRPNRLHSKTKRSKAPWFQHDSQKRFKAKFKRLTWINKREKVWCMSELFKVMLNIIKFTKHIEHLEGFSVFLLYTGFNGVRKGRVEQSGPWRTGSS